MELLWLLVLGLAITVFFQQRRLKRIEARLDGLDRPATTLAEKAEPPATVAAARSSPAQSSEEQAPPTPAIPHDSDSSSPPVGEGGGGGAHTQQLPAAPKGPTLADRFTLWLRDNWILAIAAASLALAGIFFVQYGVERGLLPPPVRVLAALAFGLGLVFTGERLRLRHGDHAGLWHSIPSTLSAAGIVSLFAAILAARHLYGLIGPLPTFAGLTATAALALILGWRHTPLLGAAGLIGATAAPFLVGGSADNSDPLYAYFALIAATGLAIDSLRRWAWMSVLALALATLAGLALQTAGAGGAGLALLLITLTALAAAIPERGILLRTQGPGLVASAQSRKNPPFPVLLALGMGIVAALTLAALPAPDAGTDIALFAVLALAVPVFALWTYRAPGLVELALPFALAFVARLGISPDNSLGLHAALWPVLDARAQGGAIALPLTYALPFIGTALIALGLWITGRRKGELSHAALSSLLPPLALALIGQHWWPDTLLGQPLWAGVLLGFAGFHTLQASDAASDAEPRRRMAWAAVAALVLIAYAAAVLFSETALTLALAALLAATALIDRRFRLPELGWLVQAGVVVLGLRLTFDPGLFWAYDAPLAQLLMAWVGALAGAGAALYLIAAIDRPAPRLMLETFLAATTAILADVLIFRWLDSLALPDEGIHWGLTLISLPWIVIMAVQFRRATLPGPMAVVRRLLGWVAGLIGLAGLLLAVTLANPLLWGEWVGRWPLFNTLVVAYGLPGLALFLLSRPGWMPRRLAFVVRWFGLFLLAHWSLLEIRRFWHGPYIPLPFVEQAELYSYTLWLMALGAGLLWLSIRRGSAAYRKVAMGVIGLTIAKVFLLDASGLTGLTRVAAFLGLGLSLVGLALLNRWAAERSGKGGGGEGRQDLPRDEV
jgi:uncharacterized membrane protein